MNANELRALANKGHISIKDSIRRRLETAASNGYYKITFTPKSYDGPFLLPESMRREFYEELTSEGFKVQLEPKGWFKDPTITISWEH